MLVVEASIEPFSYDVNSRLYCVSALGYYNKTNEGFLDLSTGKIVTVESFESNLAYNMPMTRATDTFLESLLLNSINKIKQPNRERGCVPTTAAIIVDYHDRHLGKII